MKKFGLITIASIALVIALGTSQVQRADAPAADGELDVTPSAALALEDGRSASIRGELSADYPDLAALVRGATVILVGTVLSSTPRPYENVPFTVSSLTAEQVVKGRVPVGTSIDVLQTGGLMAPRPAKGSAVQAVTVQDYSFGGVPVMKAGERYLLFLSGPASGPVAADVYLVLGEFQGKHLIDGTGRIRFNGAAGDLSDLEFAAARSVNGRPSADVLAEVRALTR